MALKFINENTGDLKTLVYTVFCFTGKSPKPRKEMEAIAIKAGASVTKSVNDRTTILVITDVNSSSSKAQKARAYAIDMISPSQFFMICSSITTSKDSNKINKLKIKKPNQVNKPSEKRKHSSIRHIQL